MNPGVKNFLRFHDAELEFVFNEGEWWVAIKPICEALKVDYNRQFQNLKRDTDLKQLYAKQHTTGADNKLYEMICLPEYIIYWWLATIHTNSEELRMYRMECAKILHAHFKGSIGDRGEERKKILLEQIKAEETIDELKQKLKETAEYKAVQVAIEKKRNLSNQAHQLDEYLIQG